MLHLEGFCHISTVYSKYVIKCKHAYIFCCQSVLGIVNFACCMYYIVVLCDTKMCDTSGKAETVFASVCLLFSLLSAELLKRYG